MELTFLQQSTAFLYSILMGVALGVVYGGFKFIRAAFNFGKVFVFIFDIIYMLVVTITVFYFSLAFLSGYVRVYVFIGSLTGFLAYRLTLGRLFSCIYNPVIVFLRKTSLKIQLKIKKNTKKLLKYAYKILYNVITKISILRNNHIEKVDNKRVMASNEKRKTKSNKKSGCSNSRTKRHKRNKT